MEDSLQFLIKKLSEIFSHFCTLESTGCLTPDYTIESSAEDLLENINKGLYMNTNKDMYINTTGFLYDKVLEIVKHFGSKVDISILYHTLRNKIQFTLLSVQDEHIQAKDYLTDKLVEVFIYNFTGELITIANKTYTDEYLDNLLIKNDVKVVKLDDVVYKTSYFGGLKVLDYMYSRKCINLIYKLAVDKSVQIRNIRKQLMKENKACVMSNFINTLLEYSYKMSTLLNFSDENDRDTMVLDKIARHEALDITNIISSISLKRLEAMIEYTDMNIDVHDVYAYMAKGYNRYDAMALSCLDWIKYFSCLTPDEAHDVIYLKANPVTFDRPTKLNCGWYQLSNLCNDTLNNTYSDALIQGYIKAKLNGIEITPDEIATISKRIHDKLESNWRYRE